MLPKDEDRSFWGAEARELMVEARKRFGGQKHITVLIEQDSEGKAELKGYFNPSYEQKQGEVGAWDDYLAIVGEFQGGLGNLLNVLHHPRFGGGCHYWERRDAGSKLLVGSI